jgi:exonuclease I
MDVRVLELIAHFLARNTDPNTLLRAKRTQHSKDRRQLLFREQIDLQVEVSAFVGLARLMLQMQCPTS